MKALTIVACLLVLPGAANSQDMMTYKVEAEVEAGKLKGLPCVLRVGGNTTMFTTPGTIELQLDEEKTAILDSLSCTYRGKTEMTETFVDDRTVRVMMNFVAKNGLIGGVVFYKQNGGVASFLDNGRRVIRVR